MRPSPLSPLLARSHLAWLRHAHARPAALASLDEALRRVVAEHGGPVAVLAGAAVSRAAPASLPIVGDFYRALAGIATAHEPRLGTSNRVEASLRHLPFEMLMEAFRRVLSDAPSDRVAELLHGIYGKGSPNRNHSLLASLVGGDIALVMTTNFDTLIERGGGLGSIHSETDIAGIATVLADGDDASRTVVHLHGSVDQPSSLGALQRRVARPLTGSRGDVLRWVRRTMPLVLVGYSGSDQDIAPLLLEPGHPHIWLNRTTVKFGGQLVATDLDRSHHDQSHPDEARPDPVDATRTSMLAWFDRLDGDEAERVLAVIADVTGRRLLAAERFRSAFLARPSTGSRVGYAGALAGLSLFGAAAQALRSTPVASGMASEPGPLLSDRAFYRRSSGDIDGALADYRTARAILERDVAAGEDRLPELLDVLWRSVEATLLVASGRRGEERRLAIAECRATLDESLRHVDANPTVPDFQLHFYRGELALLEGRFSDAAAEYRRFEDAVEPWSGRAGVVTAAVREAVALAAAGKRREAVGRWRAGLGAVISSGALVHLVQYVIAAPGLVGRPGYLWWLRRTASGAYPRYEALKLLAFRLRRRGVARDLDSP